MKPTVTIDIPPRPTSKLRVRRAVAESIKRHIRERVGYRGQGANGPLKGYSTNPLVLERGPKRRKKPARGWNAFHKGGYKQYRQELGMESDKFVFDNLGKAWADWLEATQDQNGPLSFGFSNGLNDMAADAAVDDGREDMFDLNQEELDRFAYEYLESALDLIWGTKTS